MTKPIPAGGRMKTLKRWWKQLWCHHAFLITGGGMWCTKCDYWEH